VTLQPLNRFSLDAAILFSDILMIPFGLGQQVAFQEKSGPLLSALDFNEQNLGLNLDHLEERLSPVIETVRLVKKQMPPNKTLIGFAGSPWTVAAYMIEGKTSKDFSSAKLFALTYPEKFNGLLNHIIAATCWYLDQQIQAGCEVIQLFDSWAALVPDPLKNLWIFSPTAQIVRYLNTHHPLIPVIGFPKGLVDVKNYVQKTQVQGISLDSGYPLEKALQLPCVIQGNLDPTVLVSGGDALKEQTTHILKKCRLHRHIFNLGHGILPQTPVHHVDYLIDLIKSFSE
jgi:uroporphyrinogen decarboxylase